MAGGDTGFDQVFEISMAAEAFAADWTHCDRIASYVATMVSHARADSLRYANLFSSVLNELLETAFHNHHGAGAIACAVSRRGATDRIALTLPGDAPTRAYYEAAIADSARPDAAERYLQSMLSGDGASGIMELAVDYKARLTLRGSAPGALQLVTDIVLED